MDMSNPKITFALTSCGRPDLLERTMGSFFKFNTYPIEEYYIVEDSAIKGVNDKLMEKYSDTGIKWITNEDRLVQIKSIDTMYSNITTEYIFHCEEDWEFTDYSFIEKSLKILETDSNILLVWLRDHRDTNGHPTTYFNEEYDLMIYDYLNAWNGFTFNPGLRRLCDYKLLGKYGNIGHEPDLSKEYKRLGFKCAILKTKHVIHIGYNRHINDIN